jgi:hypothetical protein
MRTTIVDRPLIVVLLNSWGKLSKYGDSGRIRDWLVASERAARADAEQVAMESATEAATEVVADDAVLQVTAARGYTIAPPRQALAARGTTE